MAITYAEFCRAEVLQKWIDKQRTTHTLEDAKRLTTASLHHIECNCCDCRFFWLKYPTGI
jgi:hypothetical protein